MASPYDEIIQRTAAKYDVPVHLLDNLVRAESHYDPTAKSPAGAQGLTQLMPDTARSLGVTNPLDPQQSIEGGAKYLSQQYQTFGNWPEALAAYNAGPGNVEKYGGIPPFKETQDYVKSILAGATGAQPGGDLAPTPTPAAVNTPTVAPPPPKPNTAAVPLLAPGLLGALNANNRILGLPALNLPAAARPAPAPLPDHPTPTTLGRAGKLKVEVAHDGPVPALATPIVQLARKWLGTPYSWGGGSPSGPTYGVGRGAKTKGFDCSAFIQYLNAQEGVRVPRTTYEQWKTGTPVDKASLMPGDAVFFEPTKQGPGHVGLYIGGGQFIESPHTGLTIRISKLDGRTDYVGARRYA